MPISQRAVYIYNSDKELEKHGKLTLDSETGLYTFVDDEANINAGDIGSTELVVAVPLATYSDGSAFIHYLRRDGYKSGLLLMSTQTRNIDDVDYQTFYLTLNQVGWTYTAGRHTFIVGYLTSDGTNPIFDKLDPAFYTVSDGVNNYEEINADEYEEIYTAIQASFTDLSNRLVNNEDFLASAFGYTKVGDQTAVEYVQYDTVSPPEQGDLPIGARAWNDDKKTTDLRLSSSVVIQDGQELVIRVRNGEATDIVNGDVVYIYGELGNSGKALVKRASSTVQDEAVSIIGVATETFSVEGFVTVAGRATFDVSAYDLGTRLYLGENGALVELSDLTKGTNIYVCVGIVESNDVLVIDPRIHYNLDDASNVEITTVANDNILIRSGTKWVNITKTAFLQSIQTQIDTLDTEKANLVGGNIFLGLQKFMGGFETEGANLKGNKITNVANGTIATDGINKGQLDNVVTQIGTDIETHNVDTDAHANQFDLKADLVGGLVPSSQLPSYVDDVEVYDTYADLPTEGELSKLYVVIADELTGNDHSTYRWTVGGYILINDQLSNAEVKSMYESNADTNAFTDALKTKITDLYNKAQLDSLLSDINTALGLRYTKTEVDALLDALKAIYGWEDSEIATYNNGDTFLATTLSEYDFILATWKEPDNTPVETYTVYFKPTDLIDGACVRTQIQNTPVRLGCLNNSSGTVTARVIDNTGTLDATNTATVTLVGVKMEQQLAENIETVHTNNTLENTDLNVQKDIDELDDKVEAEATTRASADLELKEKVAEQDKEIGDLKTQLAIANANNEPLVTQSVVSSVDHLPANTAPLPLKVNGKGLSLEQVVSNGDFSDDTNADGIADGFEEYGSTGFTTKTVSNNEQYLVAGSSAGFRLLTSDAIGAEGSTDLYYVTFEYKSTDTFRAYVISPTVLRQASSTWKKESAIINGLNPNTYRFTFDGFIDTKEYYFRNIKAINLGTNQLSLTANELSALSLPYFEGRKDIVNPTVESVGKNLFDYTQAYSPMVSNGLVDGRNTLKLTYSSTAVWDDWYQFNFLQNTQYTVTFDYKKDSLSAGNSYFAIYYTDGTRTNVLLNLSVWNTVSMTSAVSKTISQFQVIQATGDAITYFDIDTFQLEQGTVATPYEAYNKQSKTYVGTFRSVGSVQDEFNDEGVKVAKVGYDYNDVVQSATGWTTNASTTSYYQFEKNLQSILGYKLPSSDSVLPNIKLRIGSKIYPIRVATGSFGSDTLYVAIVSTGVIRLSILKTDLTAFSSLALEAYLQANDVEFIYELATPNEEPISTLGDILQGSSKAQIINSNVIADLTLYDTNADVLLTDSPIAELTYLGVMDFETGVITDLDHTTATVAGDGLSFTHASLSSGDIVVFRYTSDRINGQLDITYVNSNNVIEDTTDGKYYHVTFSTANGTPSLVATEVG